MNGNALCNGALLCALMLPAGIALAQTGEAPSIERRLSRPGAGAPSFELTPEERILTGRDDLVILRRRDFFTFEANLTPRYTSNAFLSDDNRKSDVVLNGAASLRAATVIDQRYSVFADAGVSIARYKNQSRLNYDALNTGFGGSLPVGKWTYAASYRLNYVAKPGGFSDQLITQHNLSASVSYQWIIDRNTALFPFVSVARTWANPGDFTNVSITPGASFVHRFSSTLLFDAAVQLTGRRYDDFFEAATGETRKEFGVNTALGLRWTPHAQITVRGGAGFGWVNSSIDSVDYKEFNATPSLTVKFTF